MTDNEIIKALEEWIKALKDDYKRLQALDAPMDCFEESHTDNIRVLSNALDLINRKNVEIDFVKSSRNLAEASVNTLKAELELAKAFHKEAVAERDLLNIQLKEANAEIESLKNHTDFLMSEFNEVKEKLYGITGKWDGTLGGIDKVANEVRAEAFKECIEKIKSRSTKAVMTDHGIVVAGSATYQISEVKLFEIKNELAGEQNV